MAKEYWRKCAHKMLVKLTTGLTRRQFKDTKGPKLRPNVEHDKPLKVHLFSSSHTHTRKSCRVHTINKFVSVEQNAPFFY